MKYSALDVVLACGDPRLTTTQKQILQAVAIHSSGTEGLCWAGEETLAAYANCSTKTVERNLPDLIAGGWLVFVGRHPAWGTDTYRISADAIAESLRRKDAHIKAVQEVTRARRAARLHEQAAKVASQLAALGAPATPIRHGVGSDPPDMVSERSDMVSGPDPTSCPNRSDMVSGNPIRDRGIL